MIGDRKKFIFVHIPKVAGASLKNALAKYAIRYSVVDRPLQGVISRLKGFPIRMSEESLYHGHSTVRQYIASLRGQTRGIF